MIKKIILSVSLLFVVFGPSLVLAAASSSFTYTPMEQIPGSTTDGNFCNYISAVYKFGLGGVGVAAMLMITIGGYMYIMSAGNSSSMTKAKGIIFDALLGLLLALTSYLILYEINPKLVTIDGNICSGGADNQQPGPGEVNPATGGRDCSSMQSQVPAQCSDASRDLKTLLSCVDGKLGNSVQISSISDGNGGINCWSKYNTQCPKSGGTGCCFHVRTSCHYGGTCNDGSHAVDFSAKGSSASSSSISSAVTACGGRALNEGNHIHASIGSCCSL